MTGSDHARLWSAEADWSGRCGYILATGGGSTVTIAVPHCAQHDNGAEIPAAAGNDPVRIRFRSYPYLRAFCERNGSQPE